MPTGGLGALTGRYARPRTRVEAAVLTHVKRYRVRELPRLESAALIEPEATARSGLRASPKSISDGSSSPTPDEAEARPLVARSLASEPRVVRPRFDPPPPPPPPPPRPPPLWRRPRLGMRSAGPWCVGDSRGPGIHELGAHGRVPGERVARGGRGARPVSALLSACCRLRARASTAHAAERSPHAGPTPSSARCGGLRVGGRPGSRADSRTCAGAALGAWIPRLPSMSGEAGGLRAGAWPGAVELAFVAAVPGSRRDGPRRLRRDRPRPGELSWRGAMRRRAMSVRAVLQRHPGRAADAVPEAPRPRHSRAWTR